MEKSQNILVTGGAGYIGSHACKALKNAGFNPVTFDSLITGWEEAVKFGPFERGNLLECTGLVRFYESVNHPSEHRSAVLRRL